LKMSDKSTNNNPKEQKPIGEATVKKNEKSFQAVLGGTFLAREKVVKFLPYLLFLTFLAMIYISNIFLSERNQRAIERTHEELKELDYDFKSEKSKLMFQSKPSEVARKLENTGIKESTEPPAKIIIKEKDE